MKNLWHHNYTKMTSLYYNLARNFEISPTFLIYFDWNLMGIIFMSAITIVPLLFLNTIDKDVFVCMTKQKKMF
jgi:hypothetical protein